MFAATSPPPDTADRARAAAPADTNDSSECCSGENMWDIAKLVIPIALAVLATIIGFTCFGFLPAIIITAVAWVGAVGADLGILFCCNCGGTSLYTRWVPTIPAHRVSLAPAAVWHHHHTPSAGYRAPVGAATTPFGFGGHLGSRSMPRQSGMAPRYHSSGVSGAPVAPASTGYTRMPPVSRAHDPRGGIRAPHTATGPGARAAVGGDRPSGRMVSGAPLPPPQTALPRVVVTAPPAGPPTGARAVPGSAHGRISGAPLRPDERV